MPARHVIAAAPSLAASLLVPPRCAICATPCPRTTPLCTPCDRAIATAQPAATPTPLLDAVWSAAPYEGVPRRLVAALKFHHRLPLARRAAEAIATAVPPEVLTAPIVPVPPAPWRLRIRGHDPAEDIAYALARTTGLPFEPCLARSNGPRQVGRPRAARLGHPPRVRVTRRPPTRAILLDDVITTGSTLSACARALRDAGTHHVVAVTFARA